MPKRYLLLVATFLLSVLLYVDRVCISAAKDGITTDLQLTDQQIGWAFSAFALGYALCQTPAGAMADRFGPRRLLTVVVVLWSIFTGLTGMVRGLASLIFVRALFGAGEAGAFPGMARAIYAWLPVSERGIAQGINFSGSRLGAAFALPVVAMLIDSLGWRMTFAVLMGVSLVWPLAWFWWFRDDPADFQGLSDEERQYILASRQQPRSEEPEPLSAGRLFGSRNLWFTMIQYFCSNFTFYFALTWWFPHLKKNLRARNHRSGLAGVGAVALRGSGKHLFWLDGRCPLPPWARELVASLPSHAWFHSRRGGSDRQCRPNDCLQRCGLVLTRDFWCRHDAESVVVVLHRHRRSAFWGRFGHDEHGRQHRQLCDSARLPVSPRLDRQYRDILVRWRRSESARHLDVDPDEFGRSDRVNYRGKIGSC